MDNYLCLECGEKYAIFISKSIFTEKEQECSFCKKIKLCKHESAYGFPLKK